jgi:hypothetical protein
VTHRSLLETSAAERLYYNGSKLSTIIDTKYAIDHTRWLLACGSKVFAIISFAVLRSASAKPHTKKDIVYHSAEG